MALPVENVKTCFDVQLLRHIKSWRLDEPLTILKSISNPGDLVDSSGRTLLHYAAESDHYPIIKYLIESGSQIDVQDCNGKTPLMLATKCGQAPGILLQHHANIHLCDDNGKNVIQLFDGKGQYYQILQKLSDEYSGDTDKIATKLIDLKCSAYSVIHLNNPQLTRLLLDNGCPIVPADSSLLPVNALNLAITYNSVENVKILLDHGLDVNAKDCRGNYPIYSYGCMYYNRQDQNAKMLRLLLERGANILTYNHYSEMLIRRMLCNGTRQFLQILLESIDDLNYRDPSGSSLLHYIVKNKNIETFEVLEGKELDVNARDSHGRTPLHYVCSLVAAKFLLDNGADINDQDDAGITPLWNIGFIVESYRMHRPEFCIADPQIRNQIIEYLLQLGANPQLRSFRQYSIFSNSNALRSQLYRRLSVLAHIALIEARGIFIEDFVRTEIAEDDQLRSHFEICKQQLEQMKHIKVWRSISLYDLLTLSEDKIELYVRHQKLLLNLRRLSYKNEYMPYYCYVLQIRLVKSIRIMTMRKMAADILSEVTEWHNSYDIVVDKIVKYLSEANLQKMFL